MSASKSLFGVVSLALMAIGMQLPVRAQTAIAPEALPTTVEANTIETRQSEAVFNITADEFTLDSLRSTDETVTDLSLSEPESRQWAQSENTVADDLLLTDTDISDAGLSGTTVVEAPLVVDAPTEEPTTQALASTLEPLSAESVQPVTDASELAYPATQEPTELAQARRRTRGNTAGSNFIGIGADFGYADGVSVAAISKFSISEQWAVRPTVLFGNDFSVLVPVTYDFSRYSTNVAGFQLRPYAGAGASFVSRDNNNSSNVNLLLSAGVDVPVSEQFTFNAQVNWGVLNDSQFGATVGVGYNLGNIFR